MGHDLQRPRATVFYGKQTLGPSLPFLRVVEVFPPVLDLSGGREGSSFNQNVAMFVEGVESIKDFVDIVLVAGIRVQGGITLSTTSAALLLERRAGVKAAPVIVARDSNRREVSSTVLGALSDGLESMMLAWGDRGRRGDPKDVYDFTSLSDMILAAKTMANAARLKCRILAPVNLDQLSTSRGVRLPKERIRAGADLLLAQPPTTDPGKEFDRHVRLVESADLRSRVLLSVFPFRNAPDVHRMYARFGWKLPPSLKRRASSPEYDPIGDSRSVVRRIREEGLPGVYLSTRGHPEIAKNVLG